MAIETGKKFDLKRIQTELNISQKVIDNSPIAVEELKKIYSDFQSNSDKLEKIRVELLSILNENLTGKVHSIRGRVKDADHLIEKILRNVNGKPEKYSNLTVENYNKIITDLVGIRIIILDKRDWREVHNSLLQIFRNLPERYVQSAEDIVENYDKYAEEANTRKKELENSYHAERPVVYITSKDDEDIYIDDNLAVDTSKTHYRSIHYIIRYRYVYFEIQVRTLFEEGWLEFDHRIKYPYDKENTKKQKYASVLSSLAVAADCLISFYEEADFVKELSDETQETQKKEVHLNENASVDLDFESKMKRLF